MSAMCTNALRTREESTAKCGTPDVDWNTLQTPAGWQSEGFDSRASSSKCDDGWQGMLGGTGSGRLYAPLKGSGTAIVEYKNCNSPDSSVGLYLNGAKIDETVGNEQTTKRCSAKEMSCFVIAKRKLVDL